MTKYLFAALTLAIAGDIAAYACGPYLLDNPNFRYIYHYGEEAEEWRIERKRQTVTDNCRAWAEVTSAQIPIDDIKEAVYKFSYNDYSQLHLRTTSRQHETSDNAFFKWLNANNDTETIELLMLAKRGEQALRKVTSLWYYPVEGDGYQEEFRSIAGQALSYSGKRLRDRYLVQAMRAYNAIGMYKENIGLWENYSGEKRGVVYDMIKGYAAGAYYHLGDFAAASQLYIGVKDLESLQLCSQATGEPLAALIYRYGPDSELLTYALLRESSSGSVDSTLREFAVMTAADPACRHKAIWHYTAALGYECSGDSIQALRHAKAAAQAPEADKDVAQASRMLHIYLETKYAQAYTPALEAWLYPHLRWLDSRLRSAAADYWQAEYWQSMARQILVAHIAPLCLESGYTVRALQYLNYIENRCLEPDQAAARAYWSPAQADEARPDYYNHYFKCLDSVEVKHIERLAHRMANPLCPLDSFLTSRGYGDPQYLKEIIGTRMIAQRRYSEAAWWLAQVNDQFANSRNVFRNNLPRDPFSMDYKAPRIKSDRYKINFARRMNRLEYEIKLANDSNDRAELMLQYAQAMENSFTQCWQLTSYYKGEYYAWLKFYSPRVIAELSSASAAIDSIRTEAFSLFSDPERAARAYAQRNMFSTAAKLYPNTETARNIRGHCDVVRDYASESSLIPEFIIYR